MKIDFIICNLFHIIGTLQGYACGLEFSGYPGHENLIEGLKESANVLEGVATDIRLELKEKDDNKVDCCDQKDCGTD